VYSVHRPHAMTLRNHTSPIPNCINSVPWIMQSHQLRTMNYLGYTNSVPWMYAVTLTLYHEWPGSHQLRTMNARSLSTPSSHFHSDQLRTFMVLSWCDPWVIHGMELMRFCKVALQSTKIRIKWLWPGNVTLEIIKRRLDPLPKWSANAFKSLSFI
jgi:hypothetical protein